MSCFGLVTIFHFVAAALKEKQNHMFTPKQPAIIDGASSLTCSPFDAHIYILDV